MSTRITISQVAEILKSHRDISPATLRAVVEELNAATQPEDGDEPASPKQKTQYVTLISDPEGKLKSDLVGWVLQLPESDSPHSVIDRINAAAHDFNASKKGRLIPVRSVGEALESTSRKFFKNAGLKVCTKLPCFVARTDNRLSEPPTA